MNEPERKLDETPSGELRGGAANGATSNVNRRRWLLASLALLCAGTPIIVAISRRSNRRTCEILVNWPALPRPRGRSRVPLDEHECEFVRPIRLTVDSSHLSRGHVSLMVDFKSSGPIVRGRRMRLVIEVLDDAGQPLARRDVEYTDERLKKPETFRLGPVLYHEGHGLNSVPLLGTVKHARPARIRLLFSAPA